MAGREARSLNEAQTESPLHAFSLPISAGGQPGGAGTPDWLSRFGQLWSRVGAGDLIGREVDRDRAAACARRDLDVVETDLLALWAGWRASPLSVLRCAVVPLECSARVWEAFGPAAGPREAHLLSRLHDTLVEAGRDIRAAELALHVNRSSVSLAACAARAAVADVLDPSVDPADALAALEDASVDLASLAVRLALNLDHTGATGRARSEQPFGLARQMRALVCEVECAAARRRADVGEILDGEVGRWLSDTLGIVAPTEPIRLGPLRHGDPCERADARLSLRARWVELAVGLWLIMQSLDDLLTIGTFGEQERVGTAVGLRAGRALAGCGLSQYPGAFDHERAWRRQHEAMVELVGEICRALESRGLDAVLRSQQLAMRRLTRALTAIWALDAQLRSPVQPGRGNP